MIKALLFSIFLSACGSDRDYEDRRTNPSPRDTEIEELRKQLLKLQGTTDQLQDLINSDFASCPNSGETADALIRKICQVSQAATIEARVEMKGEMSSLVGALQDKLDATNDQLADLQTSYASVVSDLADLQSDLNALEVRMDDAETAIDALEASVASITGVLNGTMQGIDIGEENSAAGPTYETVLRRSDKTRINAFVSAASTWLALGGNPLTSVNGNATVTLAKPTTIVTISNASPAVVTWTGHGWENGDPVMFATTGALPTGLAVNTLYYVRNKTINTFNVSLAPTGAVINTSSAGSGTHSGSLGLVAGDLVEFMGLAGGKGFGKGHVTGEFVVNSGATTASLQVTFARNATSGGAFGSSGALFRRVQGRGMATIWETADGADGAVRQTSLGTRLYNFIIQADGDICYSTTDSTASFATIDAEGVGIVCK